MFSFSAIWFGLYRIYTFGVSYWFLTVVPHLRYMNAVFTSALSGLRLSKAPLNVALSNCWPFCWQGLPFLLSPRSKVLSSVEHLAHSNCPPFLRPGLSASWHHCGSHCQSLTSDCTENIASPHTPLPLPTAARPSLVSFWKLFGNKKQTQGGAGRWGCDLSPLETRVPRLSRGWWSLPSQHQVFFSATQPYGIGEQQYLDPKEESVVRCADSCGKLHAMFLHPHCLRSSRLSGLISITSSFVEKNL